MSIQKSRLAARHSAISLFVEDVRRVVLAPVVVRKVSGCVLCGGGGQIGDCKPCMRLLRSGMDDRTLGDLVGTGLWGE